MGFYGNVLTSDEQVRNEIKKIYVLIEELEDSFKNQSFDIDCNTPSISNSNKDLIVRINRLEHRVLTLEENIESIKNVIGQLYTELSLTHNLLITNEEIAEFLSEQEN